MTYFPPLNVIQILNGVQFYHGTYSLNTANIDFSDVKKIYDEIQDVQKWDEDCWSAFGGFYITSIKSYAQEMAQLSSDIINTNNSISNTICTPQVHQITLLPDVELALDEDNFHWDEACKLEQLSILRLKFSMDEVYELEWESSLEKLEKEEEEAIEEYHESLDWVNDVAEIVSDWSIKYCQQAIEFWLQQGIKYYSPPELRILNDKFQVHPLLYTFYNLFREGNRSKDLF